MGIGSNIKKHRKRLGLSQAQVGNSLNVTDGTISNWENGKREPNIATLNQLAKLFEIDLGELLENTEPDAPELAMDRLDKLTMTEWTVVDGFRDLDKDAQDFVISMLEKLLSQPRNLRKNSVSKPVPA